MITIKPNISRFSRIACLFSFVICFCQPEPNAIDPNKGLSQITFKNWSLKIEINGGDVLDVLKDSNYLWLATTESGLVKFDGSTFYAYNSSRIPAFSSDNVQTLCELKNGHLLVGCLDGSIVRFNGHEFSNILTAKDSDAIVDLYEDYYGGIWVAFTSGVIKKFSYTHNDFIQEEASYIDAIQFPTFWVPTDFMFEDKNNDFYIGTQGDGLYRFREQEKEHFTEENGLNSNTIWSISEDQSGALLMCTRKGICELKDDSFIDRSSSLGIKPFALMEYVSDAEGTMWLPAKYGIHQVVNGTSDFFEYERGLYNAKIVNDPQDPIVWFTSAGNELFQFSEHPITALSNDQKINDGPVLTVVKNQNDEVWIGTYKNGINVVKNGSLLYHIGKEQGLPCKKVYALLESSTEEGTIWVGCNAGLVKIVNGKATSIYDTTDGLSDQSIRVIQEDKHNPENLWIGTINGGVNMFSNGKFKAFTQIDGLTDNNVRWLHQGEKKELWIGTQNGLHRLKDEKIENLSNNEDIPTVITRCAFEDQNKTLWIGTIGAGLMRYKNGEFKNFTKKEGLFSNNITGIWIDNSEHIYIHNSTNEIQIIEASLLENRRSQEKSYVPIPSILLSFEDGMRGFVSGGNSTLFLTKENTFLYPSMEGVMQLDMTKLDFDKKLNVTIESFKQDDEIKYYPTNIRLESEVRQLEINYSAAEYMFPHHLEYQYRLKGFDEEWVKAKKRKTAFYSNIPPGQYEFEVMSSFYGQFKDQLICSVPLYKARKWWQTVWFKLGTLLATIGFILFYISWRNGSIKRQNKLLQETVDKKTEDLQSALTNLQATHLELVQSEKMALLGTLIAGVAHEVNNPLGAIEASNSNLKNSIKFLIKSVPHLYEELSDKELELFQQFVDRIPKEPFFLTGRERIKTKNDLVQQLEKERIPNSDNCAEMLVESGVFTDLEQYYELLSSNNQYLILNGLLHYSQLQSNSRNIEIAADRAGKIVYALRSYSHNYESGTRLTISVAETIDNVLLLFSHWIKKGLEVNKFYDEVPMVIANPDELQQIWTNIIQNAFQAMEFQGHLDIRIEQKHTTRIGTHSFDQSKAYVVVTITDDGPGIPTAVQPTIFEALVSTKPPGEGSGLGLNICQRIAQDHNGTISCESESGKTSFEVWLPTSD